MNFPSIRASLPSMETVTKFAKPVAKLAVKVALIATIAIVATVILMNISFMMTKLMLLSAPAWILLAITVAHTIQIAVALKAIEGIARF